MIKLATPKRATLPNGRTFETFFHNEQNEDLRKNHMGVYSMDSITNYINFYEIIITKEMVNIHLQYLIQKEILKQECIGGVLWIFTPQKIECYLTALA